MLIRSASQLRNCPSKSAVIATLPLFSKSFLASCQNSRSIRNSRTEVVFCPRRYTFRDIHRDISLLACSAEPTLSSFNLDQDAGDDLADTIVALSSGSGKSAVAVIRVSGPLADEALLALLKPGSSLPVARSAALRNLYDPNTKEPLDKALVLRFPGPASFTGEDVVELQGHGGPAVVRALLSALTSLPGIRMAEAGEFTRQAFLGGKLDLTEVEGIADLLAAETSAQHKQALQQTSGVQRRQYEAWGKTLVKCMAHIEAVIDFGDDNDIQNGVATEILPVVADLKEQLGCHLRNARRGELVRDGVRVALVGPPNAGKSTLLNLIAGREAAIVSPVPGTTRDAVEVVLALGSHKVILTDTAGVRDTQDLVEAEGVKRARRAAADADVVVAVADASDSQQDAQLLEWLQLLGLGTPPDGDQAAMLPGGSYCQSTSGSFPPRISTGWGSHSQDSQFAPETAEDISGLQAEFPKGKPVLLLFNKCDLAAIPPFCAGGNADLQRPGTTTLQWLSARIGSSKDTSDSSAEGWVDRAGILVHGISVVMGMSARDGNGVDMLLEVLQREVAAIIGGGEGVERHMITRMRHRQHVQECIQALEGYMQVSDQLDLASEELRYAAKALGKITDGVDVEHMLDAVFSEFCVGK